MEIPGTPDPGIVSEAAAASADATAHAVEKAAEVNEDPRVAEILEDASLKANTAASRTGWLRAWFARFFRRD